MTLTEESADSHDAWRLVRALDAEVNHRYPGLVIHALDPAQVAGGRGVFVVARTEGGNAVGCGALRPLLLEGVEACGELKRMYVAPQHRKRGLARRILRHLEGLAVERFGYRAMRIETGTLQPEAIGLYESDGYKRIPTFGEYSDDPTSVCFEKRLLCANDVCP